jgi:hypothetical protein
MTVRDKNYDPNLDPRYSPFAGLQGGLPVFGGQSGADNLTNQIAGINTQLPMTYKPRVQPALPQTQTQITQPSVPKDDWMKKLWEGDLGLAENNKGLPAPHDYEPPKMVPGTEGINPGKGGAVDKFLNVLKGFGGLLAEGGYAMAHRSGGNMDDYKGHWDKEVVTNNPNSSYSKQYQDFMQRVYPDQFATPEQKARLAQIGGDDLQGTFSNMNQDKYLQMMQGQYANKALNDAERNKILLAKVSARKGTGGGGLSPVDAKQLEKYNKGVMPHESLIQDIDQLLTLSGGQNATDIEGLIKNPVGSSTHVNWLKYSKTQDKAAQARALIEAIFAGKRHELFGASLTGNELRSANEMYGKGGYSLNDILNQVRRLRDKAQQDKATLGGGYSERIRNEREAQIRNSGGGYGTQPTTPSIGGNEEVVDHTQFRGKK